MQITRQIRPFFLAGCLALAGLGLAHAPARAAVLRGRITESKSGAPVTSARVTLTALPLATPPLVRGAVSDTGGVYTVPRLPEGRWACAWQAFGYVTRRDTLTWGAADTLTRDVVLAAIPFKMNEVTVKADPYAREKAVQPGFVQLDVKELQKAPGVVEQDVIRSLQLLPGVSAASDFSSGLYVRGGGPDQTLVLLDDTPVYNPTHAFGFFSTFNGDAIRDVTLYKSAYPAQYGGRLGSVLDVNNREGDRQKLKGTGGASIIAARLTLEGPIDNGSVLVSARRTYLDPILSALRKGGNEIPAFYFYDVNARVNRAFGARNNFVLSAYHGRDDLNLDLDTGSFVNLNWGNTTVTGALNHVFSPTLLGRLVANVSDYSSDTRVSFFETPANFNNSIRDTGLRGSLEYSGLARHRLELGLSGNHYRFGLSQDFNQTDSPDLREQPNGGAAWLQDEWTPGEGTTLRGGLRANVFGQGGRFSLEPRLSASRALGPHWRWKGGAGSYSQYLQLVSTEGFSGTDFWVPTDRTIQPGRSYQVTTGLEWEPARRWQLSAETYYTKLKGLVQLDDRRPGDAEGTTSQDIFRAGGTGYATGVELFAQKRTGALTGWVGYTLGYSRRTFAEVNGGKPFPPKYDRRHDLKLVADLKRGKWTYGAALLYATGQAYTPAGARYVIRDPATGSPGSSDLLLPAPRNSGRLLPFFRLDLSATKKGHIFGLPVDWVLQVFNATNRQNEWFIQYNTDDPDTKPEVTHQLPILPTFGVNFAF